MRLVLPVVLLPVGDERLPQVAERHFREIVDRFPDSESAAEAMYWSGVSRYKGSGDAAALGETARAFSRRYQESSWAKKASVWS